MYQDAESIIKTVSEQFPVGGPIASAPLTIEWTQGYLEEMAAE